MYKVKGEAWVLTGIVGAIIAAFVGVKSAILITSGIIVALILLKGLINS